MRLILATLFIFLSIDSSAQHKYIPPFSGKIKLTGSFGELRGNHFHMGLDMSTQATKGRRILAVKNGYIERIQVSTSGYGKAIYIKHQDGNISLYAHLDHFSPWIEKVLKQKQYERESFEIKFYPRPYELSVKQGEIIGYSGNTGSSNGPHLHFEIRDKYHHPINPQLFPEIDAKIRDNSYPRINGVYLYTHLDPNQAMSKERIKLKYIRKGFFRASRPVTVDGLFGFGISTWDRQNNPWSKNGVYDIKLLDSRKRLLYHFEVDTLNFNQKRFINNHIDYRAYINQQSRIQKCFVNTIVQDNVSNIKVKNYGLAPPETGFAKTYTLEIKDIKQNLTTVEVYVKGVRRKKFYPELSQLDSPEDQQITISPFRGKHIDDKHVSLNFPKGSVSEATVIRYNIGALDFKVGSPDIPLFKPFSLNVRFSKELFGTHNKQIYLTKYNIRKKKYKPVWARKNTNSIEYKSYNFGKFKIEIDTVEPIIRARNYSISMKRFSKFRWKVYDNESGVNKVHCLLNYKWVLCEYEPKERLIWYNFSDKPDYLNRGINIFQISITDLAGNTHTKTYEFIK